MGNLTLSTVWGLEGGQRLRQTSGHQVMPGHVVNGLADTVTCQSDSSLESYPKKMILVLNKRRVSKCRPSEKEALQGGNRAREWDHNTGPETPNKFK